MITPEDVQNIERACQWFADVLHKQGFGCLINVSLLKRDAQVPAVYIHTSYASARGINKTELATLQCQQSQITASMIFDQESF